MSDTDDTDLLLIIPPDFFLVNSSDSEDSVTSFGKGKQQTVDRGIVHKLVDHVSKLENRVQLIERKDNISESGNINQSVDYSYSLDSSKLLRGDLALRLYSMSTTDYRIESDISKDTFRTPTKPRPVSLPTTPSRNEIQATNACRRIPFYPSTYLQHEESSAFSVLGVKEYLSKPAISEICDALDVTAMSETSVSNCSYPMLSEFGNRRSSSLANQDISFLSEIDDFLENKNNHRDIPKMLHSVNDIQVEPKSDNFNPMISIKPSAFNHPNNSILNTHVNRYNKHSIHSNENDSPKSFVYGSTTLSLSQVNNLLLDMQKRQCEIEQKILSGKNLLEPLTKKNGATLQKKSRNITSQTSQLDVEMKNSVTDDNFTIFSADKESTKLPDLNQQKFAKAGDTILNIDNATKNTSLTQASQNGVEQCCQYPLDKQIGDHVQCGVNEIETCINENIVAGKAFTVGDTIGSVPNLNLGIRDLMANSDISFSTEQKPTNSIYQNVDNNPPNVNDSVNEDRNLIHSSKTCKLAKTDSIENGKQIADRVKEQHNKQENIDHKNFPAYDDIKRSHSFTESTQLNRLFPSIGKRTLLDYCPFEQNSCIAQPSESSSKVTNNLFLRPNKMTQHFTTSSRAPEQSSAEHDYFEDPQSKAVLKNKVDLVLSDKTSGRKVNAAESRSFNYKDNPVEDLFSSNSNTLLSLSELWGKESSSNPSRLQSGLEHRLEEEKYRRQHCERLIQHLQLRLLEEQEKLAVAMKVDQGKDQAIAQLQSAWEKLVGHWKDLEEQRYGLSQQLQSEREVFQADIREMSQKLKVTECEVSKALDLAQGYKVKSDNLEKEYKNKCEKYESFVKDIQLEVQKISGARDSANAEKEKLSKQLQISEELSRKDKDFISGAKSEIKKTKETLCICEMEIKSIKEQKDSLHLMLKDERSKNQVLEQRNKTVQTELQSLKRRERELNDELKEVNEQLRKVKTELRDHFQQQVDTLVENKLKEFQAQLDAAETSMEQKESAIQEIAQQQVKLITDKFQTEVRLLEEKHNEEIQLYQLQLTKTNQELSKLQSQLKQHKANKSEIIEKLHTVMETQWKEALRIVGGNSPVILSQTKIMRNIPTLDSESNNEHKGNANYIPLCETPISKKEFSKMLDCVKRTSAFLNGFPSPLQQGFNPKFDAHSSTPEGTSFNTDNQTKCMEEQIEIPVVPGAELKKYIQKLLDKAPGNPANGVNKDTAEKDSDQQHCNDIQIPAWYSFDDLTLQSLGGPQTSLTSSYNSKERKMLKPPWK